MKEPQVYILCLFEKYQHTGKVPADPTQQYCNNASNFQSLTATLEVKLRFLHPYRCYPSFTYHRRHMYWLFDILIYVPSRNQLRQFAEFISWAKMIMMYVITFWARNWWNIMYTIQFCSVLSIIDVLYDSFQAINMAFYFGLSATYPWV